MTQTYFTKTVISERNIVITTQLMGEEHMSVIVRGPREDQDLGAAIISHKESADVAFGISTAQEIEQRAAVNQKITATAVSQ